MSILRRTTLRQFRIFEAAARHLHFGRTAAELNLSQPAVSIQLKQLEADIGLPLFEQMGRRMHLTRAGGELAGHARAVLMRICEADEALEGLKDAGAGEIMSHRRRPPNISCRVSSPRFAAAIHE